MIFYLLKMHRLKIKNRNHPKNYCFLLCVAYIYNINGFQSPMFFISVITYHLGFAQKKNKYIYIYIEREREREREIYSKLF